MLEAEWLDFQIHRLPVPGLKSDSLKFGEADVHSLKLSKSETFGSLLSK